MITNSEETIAETSTAAPVLSSDSSSQQLLLPSKFITHHPKAGLNPLVDAAAYLFSIMGKLKQIKSYRNLDKLHNELTQEIHVFQDAIKAQGYSSEYLLVSRYALCATLDDIIIHSPWGSQGQWNSYSLLSALNQEPIQQDRFFILLDRICKEPALYIDVMELMYLCLSFGYKGSYRSTEFSLSQLEQITNALYRRIRTQRGDFSKALSPFPIKATPTVFKVPPKKIPLWLIAAITIVIILGIFIALGHLLDNLSYQAYQELIHIGKSIIYETHNT